MRIDKLAEWMGRQLEIRGWSYNELSRRSGLSQSMISKVMAQAVTPGLKFYEGIADAFNIPLAEILRVAGILPNTRGDFIDEVTDILKQLSVEERAYIYDLVKVHYRHSRTLSKHAKYTNTDRDD